MRSVNIMKVLGLLILTTLSVIGKETGSTLMECFEQDLNIHIVLVAWKGKTSVRAYVAKSDRIHYLRLCGADVSKFGMFLYYGLA